MYRAMLVLGMIFLSMDVDGAQPPTASEVYETPQPLSKRLGDNRKRKAEKPEAEIPAPKPRKLARVARGVLPTDASSLSQLQPNSLHGMPCFNSPADAQRVEYELDLKLMVVWLGLMELRVSSGQEVSSAEHAEMRIVSSLIPLFTAQLAYLNLRSLLDFEKQYNDWVRTHGAQWAPAPPADGIASHAAVVSNSPQSQAGQGGSTSTESRGPSSMY